MVELVRKNPAVALGVVLAANAITQDSGAAASGNPGYCRVSTAGRTAVIDLDVSAAGGAGAVQLSPYVIVAGAPVTLSSLVISEA